jgi:hypothetical protein
VALNQLELARLQNRHSNQLLTEEINGREEMAEREWFWRVTPKKAAASGFVQLEISVFRDEQQQNRILQISGHIDQFHRLVSL